MSLFAQVKQANVSSQDKDVLGGTLPTNVYDARIKLAYISKAASGALSVTVEVVLNNNGSERNLSETMYISNKEGSFTFKNREGGDEPLPGYTMFDSICKAAVGVAFTELTPEVKMVKVKADKDPEQREVFMELLGKNIKLGIVEETVDKTSKNDATGKYEPTGETRDQNTISKVFDADGLTATERAAGRTEPEFMTSWVNKFGGKKFNKAKGKKTIGGIVAGAPAQAAAAPLNIFG